MAESHTLQQVAAEAFLRGCRHKELATIVLNEGPANIQSACQRLNTLVANMQAVCGGPRGSPSKKGLSPWKKKIGSLGLRNQ